MPIIEISSLTHPGVDVFCMLTEAQLRQRMEPGKGVFIAESPNVISRALDAGYEPLALMCERKHISGSAAHIIKRCGDVPVYTGEECKEFVLQSSPHGGADVVFEVAGGEDTFRLAWECARPNAVVILVALYDRPQILPLPDMYGKNLTFKTGGVDGCDCAEILRLIEMGKIDTTPLITHRFPLDQIETAYQIFENRQDGVIKVAVTMETGM